MGVLGELIRPTVTVEICGTDCEALLNQAAARGLALREISCAECYVLRASLPARELAELTELGHRCMCDVKKLPGTDMRRLLRRRISLLCALGAVLGCIVLSGFFVWDIEISGGSGHTKGDILRALRSAGLECGSFRPGLDTETVRSRALNELPGIAWMGISLSGSRAHISVLEREAEPELYGDVGFSDIEAAKNGVIKSISVLSGSAQVSEGQAVRAGETLVSGVVESISAPPRLVRSDAEVMAYTWYELTLKCPEREFIKSYTGRSRDRFSLNIGKKRINFYLSGRNNIDECDKIVYEYKIGIKGVFALPVTLVRESMREYKLKPGKRSLEELKLRLRACLESETAGEILSCGYSSALYDGVLSVTLRAHCLEDIAVERNSA